MVPLQNGKGGLDVATLKELADRTGYSQTTISRILSGDPTLSVTPEARRRVLEETGRLNYAATRSRRGRAPKEVLRVGVAEMLTPAQQLEDPYYLYLSSFVRQECREKKYACLPMEARGDGFLPPAGEGLDGVVAIGLFTPAQIEGLAAVSPNVVFVDSSPFESCFDSVVLGYELGISLALEHLTGLGHRHIGFVGPEYKLDDRPIDPACTCPTCAAFSRAYVRHLLAAGEMLAMRLAVMHNLHFYNELMARIRQALDEGRFEAFRAEYSEKLGRPAP